MTTPWKTWMRERLPSTTRTWTLTVSPGRNSGMSSRNESASSASRVFISAVLSSRQFTVTVRTAVRPGRPFRGATAPAIIRRRAPVGFRRSAAALYCATSSVDDARRPRPRPVQQLLERVGQPGRDDDLLGVAEFTDGPPPVGLVLVRLDRGLP